MSDIISIAIDGPSGVGKSTLAKSLASRLGYTYVDTGAMFRTFAVCFIDKRVNADDEAEVSAALEGIDISIRYEGGLQHMILNGQDVTGRLRTEEVSRMASVTSQYKTVRERLLKIQRDLAAKQSVIMDGRDIGTVVLPDARLKVFLTADTDIRAKRRFDELKACGKLGGSTFEDIKQDLEERDYRDTHREIAPLKPAADAHILDTSHMSAEDVEDAIAQMVKEIC